MADKKAKLTLTVEVDKGQDNISMDMTATDAFHRLPTELHLTALKLIIHAIAEAGSEICDADDQHEVDWVNKMEAQAKADTDAMFERVMGRPQ